MEQNATGLKLLIADDDADIRAIISSSVQMMGFDPLEAEDGEQAVSICREQMPDLIILDLMMPGLDGLQACQEIRKFEGGDITPIIMLTAQDNMDDRVRSLSGGLDDYLTKPFRHQELQARLTALLRVRNLNLQLKQKNIDLQRMQDKLIQQERLLATQQIAGTAAHQLGQPLSAIILNLHLLESLDASDQKFRQAIEAIRQDSRRMAALIDALKQANPNEKEHYHGGTEILKVEEGDDC